MPRDLGTRRNHGECDERGNESRDLLGRARKIVITNRADEARPQSVHTIDWNLKPTFKDSVFKFTPPKGATKVELVPLKTK